MQYQFDCDKVLENEIFLDNDIKIGDKIDFFSMDIERAVDNTNEPKSIHRIWLISSTHFWSV